MKKKRVPQLLITISHTARRLGVPTSRTVADPGITFDSSETLLILYC